MKRREDGSNSNEQNLAPPNDTGFNPSKTFGGARNKMPMFPLKPDYDDFAENPGSSNRK